MNLTNKVIGAFEYRGGWDVRWDSKVSGLGLRVYPSGRKAFVLSYRNRGGDKRLYVIGPYGEWTVARARIEAEDLKPKIRKGFDPIDDRRQAKVGDRFRDLADDYIENHAKVNKKTWKEDKRRIDTHIPSGWFRKKADGIKRSDVAKLYSDIRKTRPYEANRVLALLHHMFKLGEEWGHVPEGSRNPAVVSKEVKFKEQSRRRYMTPQELPRIAKAIDKEQNIYVRSALWLYLLTGLRKSELLTTKRADIRWDEKRLWLPDTKAGEEQYAALNSVALAIMQATPELEGNPYLFPGRRKGGHLVNIDVPWRRVRKNAKCEDLRLHDLRRTVGSWLTQSGVDLNTIKQALRHADIQTTLVYARLADDSTRQPMEEHGQRVLEIAGRKGPLVVIEGGGGRK